MTVPCHTVYGGWSGGQEQMRARRDWRVRRTDGSPTPLGYVAFGWEARGIGMLASPVASAPGEPGAPLDRTVQVGMMHEAAVGSTRSLTHAMSLPGVRG